MAKVTYRNWAYVIRFLMILYSGTTLLGFVLSIVGDVTETDFSITRVDYGYRNYNKGYPVKTNVYFDIPDTVLARQAGTLKYEKKYWQQSWINEGIVKDTIINHFKNFDKSNKDEIKNFIGAPDQVNISVHTTNNFHKWFYIVYDQLPRLFLAIIFFWIILLINNYLNADFFNLAAIDLSLGLALVLF